MAEGNKRNGGEFKKLPPEIVRVACEACGGVAFKTTTTLYGPNGTITSWNIVCSSCGFIDPGKTTTTRASIN